MKKLIAAWIDSFTKEKFKGNPAVVLLNGDIFTNEKMQMIAKEPNNSETVSIFLTDSEHYGGLIGYFTPKKRISKNNC